MPIRSHDLHGSAPDKSTTALLLIDVINDFDFEEGEQLLRLALPVGKNIAALKKRTRDAGIPSIYVNDNFGRWQSDLNKTVDHCLHESRGKPFVELLLPAVGGAAVTSIAIPNVPALSGLVVGAQALTVGDNGPEAVSNAGLARIS